MNIFQPDNHSFKIVTNGRGGRARRHRYECSCTVHRGVPGSNFGVGEWMITPNDARNNASDHYRRYHR